MKHIAKKKLERRKGRTVTRFEATLPKSLVTYEIPRGHAGCRRWPRCGLRSFSRYVTEYMAGLVMHFPMIVIPVPLFPDTSRWFCPYAQGIIFLWITRRALSPNGENLIGILTYCSADSPEGKAIALRGADVSRMHPSATFLFIDAIAHMYIVGWKLGIYQIGIELIQILV